MLQNAILSRAYCKSTQIYTMFPRLFRAYCVGGFASGAGQTVECLANIHATEHALRYIGAYVLVSVIRDIDEALRTDVVQCWKFGSQSGFCI